MSSFVMNKIARAISNRQGPFQHRFGGPPVHQGNIPNGARKPLHLLYTFDTTDPAFPVQITGVRYLPLYYGFPYNAGACGYRVLSDQSIEILYMENNSIEKDFPYEAYPDEFPAVPITLAPVTEEEHKSLVYYLTLDEYHLDSELSDEDRNLLKDLGYPFTQLGGIQRMWQGIPDVQCPNKSCENHLFSHAMDVFAVVWGQPVPGAYLWDDTSDEADRYDKGTQVIFQICPMCQAIHVCNRCT